MSVSHLWLGLLSSIVIMIVCLTGSIYAFKAQITDLINYDHLTVKHVRVEKTPVDSLLRRFEKQIGTPTQLYIFPEAHRSVVISSFTKDNPGVSIYYDPYTGKQVGVKSASAEFFFEAVLNLHRFLLAGDVGKMVVGTAVLIFVYMLLSGFILWLPTKWNQIKNAFVIKWKARFYRLNYDLHKVLGFYFLILLFVMSMTGLYVSFHWMKNVMIVSLGGNSIIISETNIALKKELSQSFENLLGDLEMENTLPVTSEARSIQKLISKADSVFQYPGAQQWQLPNEQVNTIQLTKLNTLTIPGFVVPDRMEFSANGKIRTVNFFSDLPLHEQFKAIAKPLHTGEVAGIPGVILYFLTSLIGCTLPVTGFIIWIKKNFNSIKR